MTTSTPTDPTTGASPRVVAAPDAARPRRPIPPALIVALAVGIAVVVVVGGLALSGRFGPGSTSQLGPYPTFAGAVSEAQPAANSVSGGPWQAAFGAAIRLPSPLQFPTRNITQVVASLGCNVTLLGVPPSTIAVDETPLSEGPGTSGFWLVGFVNTSGGVVGVTVNDGAATALFDVSTTACPSITDSLLPFPSGAWDSSSVIGAVNGAGGATFLASHPNASQLFFGVGGFGLLAPEPVWVVAYNSCPLALVANSSGSEFNSTVEGTTVASHSSGSVSCTALPSLHLPSLVVMPTGTEPLRKAI